MKATVEQRQQKRYRLAASVSFSWETVDHRVQQGVGQTRDCSISGVFIVTPRQLPIGSFLHMDFSLPPLHVAGRGSRLKTRGRIVRNESEGFAVVADMGLGSRLHREENSHASVR
jgi:hypothetical protein